MKRWAIPGMMLVLQGCAQQGPLPAATGPIYSIPFAADAVTSPDQAFQTALLQGQSQCQSMGNRRFALVEEQVNWPRGSVGGRPETGTLRFRCF